MKTSKKNRRAGKKNSLITPGHNKRITSLETKKCLCFIYNLSPRKSRAPEQKSRSCGHCPWWSPSPTVLGGPSSPVVLGVPPSPTAPYVPPSPTVLGVPHLQPSSVVPSSPTVLGGPPSPTVLGGPLSLLKCLLFLPSGHCPDGQEGT